MANQNIPGLDNINIPPIVKRLFRNIWSIIAIIVVAIVLFSSFFIVNPEEVGVVMRFGEYNRTVSPGLNFKMPFVEEKYLVPVERQLKHEFGFRTERADVRTEYQRSDFSNESLMLTGDLNLANVEWVVQYRISDPYNYLFKIRNPENTLRDVSEAAVRQIVGNRTVNEVLTIGRSAVASEAQELIQELAREYETGIHIQQIVLQDINPPDPVKPSFNAVNEAQQQKETLINEAKSEYNRVIPRAKGEAQQTIEEARGYATERINEAQGNAARFNELYNEYISAPEVTKRRLYLETLTRVLPELGNKVITDTDGQNVLPLMQMQMNKSGFTNSSGSSSTGQQ